MRLFWAALALSLLIHLFLVPAFWRALTESPAPPAHRAHRVQVTLRAPQPTPPPALARPTPTPASTPRPAPTPVAHPTPVPVATPRPTPRAQQTPPPRPVATPIPIRDVPPPVRALQNVSPPATAPTRPSEPAGRPSIIAASPGRSGGPVVPAAPTVGAAGRAGVVPTAPSGRGYGESTAVTPPAQPPVAAPMPTPPPAPRPTPTPTPTPAPTPPPAPTPTPAPVGPTREAECLDAGKIKIPPSLRQQVLSTSMRVKFEIGENGDTIDVFPMSSTGSRELDAIAVEQMRTWKWRAALRDGVPVRSSQKARVEFEVQ